MNPIINRLLALEKPLGSNYTEQSLGYKSDDADAYDLSDVEFLTIRMLVSNGESLIQRHLYQGVEPTELEQLLCENLDSALSKIPVEDTTDIVYRWDKNPIVTLSDKGKIITYPAYLTSSKTCFPTNLKYCYIIHLSSRTKARSIYKAYEITPSFPEYQVEFPKGTQFLVLDYRQDGDYTVIEMVEQVDYQLPVEKLAGNIVDFFKNIISIDIPAAEAKGLCPLIRFQKSVDGKNINSRCGKDGRVYLSPTYAQALWCLCYVALYLSDKRIIDAGFEAYHIKTEDVCKEIEKSGTHCVECDYIYTLCHAYDWEDMLLMCNLFRKNQYSLNDLKILSNIDVTNNAFTTIVNGAYRSAVGAVLTHELVHFNSEHFERMSSEQRRDLEMEADNKAMEAVLAIKDEKERKTAEIGVMCAYLLSFFNNYKLLPSAIYYREDVRLFTQYDKVTKEKRQVSIIVANILTQWLKQFHNVEIQVKQDREDETVEEIRKTITDRFGVPETPK